MQASRLALGFVLFAAPVFAQETTRVSVDSAGGEANGLSQSSSISGDGGFVAYESVASDLVAGDTNGFADVFVHDRAIGTTERVSVDSSGVEGNGNSRKSVISADGRFVAFYSEASNLVAGDTNGVTDVFVHDRTTGSTERVSVDSSGVEANGLSITSSISADGRYVAFWSGASNLVAGDTNGTYDAFVHDRTTGTTERISVDSSGAEGNSASSLASISADGRIVAFQSFATNFAASDTNGTPDVFVHDRSTGVTERVSVDSSGAEADDLSIVAAISADGQFVTFESAATNLVAGDTNGRRDVFVHELSTGIVERVSLDSTGAEGNGESRLPRISSDGRYVAFLSDASNLVAGDTNGTYDVFVHDRSTGSTERISVDSSGAEGNGRSILPSISADGQIVAYNSDASNLVAGDTNAVSDVFVHERCAVDAAWTNYGAGFPGTNGVPSFTSQADPVLGTTITLDVANSSGVATIGLLFVGYQRASLHSALGGDLLLIPALTSPIGLPQSGASFTGALPADLQLCGFVLDLQVIESDAGAAKGVSFTPGLELLLGH